MFDDNETNPHSESASDLEKQIEQARALAAAELKLAVLFEEMALKPPEPPLGPQPPETFGAAH